MAQTFGSAKLWWRGVQYDIQQGVKVRLAGKKNNKVEGTQRTLRSTMWEGGEVQATIIPTQNMKLDAFDPALGEGELQIQYDSGKSIVISDAWINDKPEATDKGEAPVTWTFNNYEELD
ncbi:hypothetical protein E3E12_06010 [Formicincola oecophyllae]|uniref:Phage tail protein n=1 Tax=Formicincola oecophyllae TaxID=2558361 RepID=A0A4Y6UA24_9PROT|nr:phage tail tube protein [Formicincola oecophyllae]QDH13810.1 hypothetical protein E3E12_06010 [Formicincola oecophyllae]